MPSRVRGLMRERMRSRARRPPRPARKPSAGQGHPRRNASPLWAFSRWIFLREAPVRRGPIPRASVRRNASGASEGPARSPAPARRESPRPRHSPPIPDRAARARAPSPLPPLFLLLFLIGHTLRKGFPEGYGQGFGRSPGKISGTAGGNAGRGPAQHAGERLGERAAEPLPKRPDGLTRALQHGPLQRGFRQVPEGPHPRAHNIGRFRHVVAEEVREPYERGLGVLLGDAEREDFPNAFRNTFSDHPSSQARPGAFARIAPSGVMCGCVSRNSSASLPLSESSRTLASFRCTAISYGISSPFLVWRPGRPCRPPKPQVFLQLFRSLAPRDETPAKRQRRADDAGLAPDWAGQGVPSAGAQPRAGSRKRALSHVRNG